MLYSKSLLLLSVLSLQASAAPTPVDKRAGILGNLLSSLDPSDLTQIQSVLQGIVPSSTPTSVEEAASRLQSAYASATPSGLWEAAALVLNLGVGNGDLQSIAAGVSSQAENNPDNSNPRNPAKSIYPKKSSRDAPYHQFEKNLRDNIYIPSSFTYGQKPPVILVPGTGARGGNNFIGNLIPLLQGKSYADLVWINPNVFQLADAQSNAENVAYAINYISGISNNRNVSIIGWSQGSESCVSQQTGSSEALLMM